MMNRYMKTWIIAVLYLAISHFTYAQEWISMKHDTLHFTVQSPQQLIPKTNTAMTEVGNLIVNSFGLIPEKGNNLLFQVIVLNYPEGSFPQDSLDLRTVMLTELIQQSASANEAEVIYQQEIQSSGLIGVQWRVHSGTEISIKSRAFVYDDKIYIAQVMSKMSGSLNLDVDKFLNGFTIQTL